MVVIERPLDPGRTSRQGTSLNVSKLEGEYCEETATLFMCPDDMTRLSLKNGDRVRLKGEQGTALSAPALMLATQAALTAVVARRPTRRAAQALTEVRSFQ